MFEALFRIVVQVETDEQGQRAFPVTVHLNLPPREVERTFHFRQDRLFEGEGIQQPLADLLPLVQAIYEKFVQQVVPGDVFTLTFHVEQP